jgi:signal transduction histidine kinase
VIDQGEGIENDNIEMIFEKFSQSSSGKKNGTGTGLGLAICKEIITAHKGRIWAESSPQCGTKFSFTIPINIQPTHPKQR